MYYQQRSLIIPANSSEEFERERKNLCFRVALAEEGGRYETTEEINKVNKKYLSLYEQYKSEQELIELERRAFQNV